MWVRALKKIEINIYAIAETAYKFCHPLYRHTVDETHDIYDGFLEKLVEKYPGVEWYVDLKCLDLDKVPLRLLEYLAAVFGSCGIITAAQPEILEFAHNLGQKAAQYFKDNLASELEYAPDLFVQNDSENKKFQKENTIVYCLDLKTALNYLDEGYAGAMVDGSKLIAG